MSRSEAAIYRRRQVMHQRILFISFFTVAIIICGVLLGSSIMASGHSKASGTDPSFKYYTSIRIQEGDTLWSIAEEFLTEEYDSIPEYIDEIKTLNQLGPDDIHAGQYLSIPYYSHEFH